MPTPPDFSLFKRAVPAPRNSAWSLAVLLGLLLSGCTAVKPAASEAAARLQPAAPTTMPATEPQASVAASVPAAAPPSHQPDPALWLAAYAEQLRTMQPAGLSAELIRLASSVAPQSQLQLALALAQMQQLPEMIRAQETVAKVLGNSSDEAKALHPVARLLAVRLSQERRLEDLLDKQNQQLKDLQRRLDQTTERLEALKAIERSLVSRPPAALPPATTPAPGIRTRIPPSPAPAPARSGTPQP